MTDVIHLNAGPQSVVRRELVDYSYVNKKGEIVPFKFTVIVVEEDGVMRSRALGYLAGGSNGHRTEQ